MGEVAAFAQVLEHAGILNAIQEQVRFARARFGTYDLIDFMVVLIWPAPRLLLLAVCSIGRESNGR
ncbi:hypothetical protein KSB_67230 [Ktedonobacter robiniae]|uniref:Uncharacterized protein n=2 Tax=Ktedonobacter robiniae TaxID=2778365 RepID=A0ABQ3V005_9CHLR|nr:hypothetical protein KSB_67230 [Ktedonobacter robiniae]